MSDVQTAPQRAMAPSNRARWLCLSLILLAFALRVTRLDAQSLWYDEGVTATIAQFSLGKLMGWTANDIQPPLYYILVAFWGRLAGWSEWSLRYVSVMAGVATVPLLAKLAGRLARTAIDPAEQGRRPASSYAVRAALLTALFAALHPLLIYYSQEARMYALLTALAVAMGCLFERLLARRRAWIGFALVSLAAVYTHYFAFFLLLAFGLAALAPGVGGWRLFRAYVLALTATLVGYLPWVVTMLTRFAVDNSYWPGRLDLGDALISILISFTSGETVSEPQARALLLIYLLITVAAVASLFRHQMQGHRIVRFLAIWLIVPVAAVLTLTSYAPKFNARYVMIALPPLLLVWGIGLSATPFETQRQPIFNLHSLRSAAIPLALALLLLFSTANWYLNPVFTKDQWRELTVDLRARIQPHEAVVLVSGHTWPVWEYYAPDIPAVRLPDLTTLEVDAVLDFEETVPPLRAALDPLSERPGVWLIGWQDDVVDPMGVVPAQLEIAGREKGMSSRYWGLNVRRFSQLKTHWMPTSAPITVAVDATFGEAVTLLGYDLLDNGDLLLFWQLLDAVPNADFAMTSLLQPAEGADQLLEDRRLAGYYYPSFRWPIGRVTVGYLRAAEWLGAEPQPGRYTLQVGVYDAADPTLTLLETRDGESKVSLGPIDVVID